MARARGRPRIQGATQLDLWRSAPTPSLKQHTCSRGDSRRRHVQCSLPCSRPCLPSCLLQMSYFQRRAASQVTGSSHASHNRAHAWRTQVPPPQATLHPASLCCCTAAARCQQYRGAGLSSTQLPAQSPRTRLANTWHMAPSPPPCNHPSFSVNILSSRRHAHFIAPAPPKHPPNPPASAAAACTSRCAEAGPCSESCVR
mmetsp:Transcript_17092/g.42821  ORF Transcript_17092/g.42821 Transcript_17092/m.42821 type:complete len:200 (+) Transcript_17092:747-1346(+)